ncbi:hypothetical protein MTO96_000645 [Rhipicephalus appendiculatus]
MGAFCVAITLAIITALVLHVAEDTRERCEEAIRAERRFEARSEEEGRSSSEIFPGNRVEKFLERPAPLKSLDGFSEPRRERGGALRMRRSFLTSEASQAVDTVNATRASLGSQIDLAPTFWTTRSAWLPCTLASDAVNQVVQSSRHTTAAARIARV